MMVRVAFTSLLLSAGTMVFGSPTVLTGRDDISAAEDDWDWCLLRTYISPDCVGEERNGFLWAKPRDCKPCGDIEGEFHAVSFQGPCPNGMLNFYNESGCATDSSLGNMQVPFNWYPSNETCFPIDYYQQDGLAKSIQMCFPPN